MICGIETRLRSVCQYAFLAADLLCHERRVISELSIVAHTLRVTTCLENLEMSGNLEHVREMSGKNLVMEKCPKTVHC